MSGSCYADDDYWWFDVHLAADVDAFDAVDEQVSALDASLTADFGLMTGSRQGRMLVACAATTDWGVVAAAAAVWNALEALQPPLQVTGVALVGAAVTAAEQTDFNRAVAALRAAGGIRSLVEPPPEA